MPELPEVEVVRRGAHTWTQLRTISDVEVLHPRAVRRHVGGGRDLSSRLAGTTVVGSDRRGKYMWLLLDSGEALVVHLGMSGQLRVVDGQGSDENHLRVRIRFTDGGQELHFVDQRTFGGVFVDQLIGPGLLPSQINHIARDPLDPAFSSTAVAAQMVKRRSPVKAVLLDQSVVSGIGNIYADEALWRSRINWARSADSLQLKKLRGLLDDAGQVMSEALEAGGTSFDALYVNVNGASGYFSRSLVAYGQTDRPCPRCGALIIREKFANRSSFRCPRCQTARGVSTGR